MQYFFRFIFVSFFCVSLGCCDENVEKKEPIAVEKSNSPKVENPLPFDKNDSNEKLAQPSSVDASSKKEAELQENIDQNKKNSECEKTPVESSSQIESPKTNTFEKEVNKPKNTDECSESSKCLKNEKCECFNFVEESKKYPIVEISYKPAYFFPQDSLFRHIYSGGYITLGQILFYLWEDYITLFIEGGYFKKHGKIVEPDGQVSTKIAQAPITLGFGVNYPVFSNFDLYLNIGPNYLFTKETRHSPYFKPKTIKHSVGGTVEGGIKFSLFKYLVLDLFIDYRFNRKKIHDSRSELTFHRYLGGVDIGMGLGFKY
jgi:hypothetical protein